jgi:hypothetical protein
LGFLFGLLSLTHDRGDIFLERSQHAHESVGQLPKLVAAVGADVKCGLHVAVGHGAGKGHAFFERAHDRQGENHAQRHRGHDGHGRHDKQGQAARPSPVQGRGGQGLDLAAVVREQGIHRLGRLAHGEHGRADGERQGVAAFVLGNQRHDLFIGLAPLGQGCLEGGPLGRVFPAGWGNAVDLGRAGIDQGQSLFKKAALPLEFPGMANSGTRMCARPTGRPTALP